MGREAREVARREGRVEPEPRSILLVEDNPDDVALTLRAFDRQRLANAIEVVGDGAAALDRLFARGAYADRAGSPLPQVVLLDLKLPKVDGLEVLRALRGDARTRVLPVVVLTSSIEDRDVERAYGLGANGYIRKPVDFQQFVDAVRQVGLYWLLLNVPPPRPSAAP
jgi:two-component system response regulator